MVPAPKKDAFPTVTPPHKWQPGAIWTPLWIRQSWSTVAAVFIMTLSLIAVSELITVPAMITVFAAQCHASRNLRRAMNHSNEFNAIVRHPMGQLQSSSIVTNRHYASAKGLRPTVGQKLFSPPITRYP